LLVALNTCSDLPIVPQKLLKSIPASQVDVASTIKSIRNSEIIKSKKNKFLIQIVLLA